MLTNITHTKNVILQISTLYMHLIHIVIHFSSFRRFRLITNYYERYFWENCRINFTVKNLYMILFSLQRNMVSHNCIRLIFLGHFYQQIKGDVTDTFPIAVFISVGHARLNNVMRYDCAAISLATAWSHNIHWQVCWGVNVQLHLTHITFW